MTVWVKTRWVMMVALFVIGALVAAIGWRGPVDFSEHINFKTIVIGFLMSFALPIIVLRAARLNPGWRGVWQPPSMRTNFLDLRDPGQACQAVGLGLLASGLGGLVGGGAQVSGR